MRNGRLVFWFFTLIAESERKLIRDCARSYLCHYVKASAKHGSNIRVVYKCR